MEILLNSGLTLLAVSIGPFLPLIIFTIALVVLAVGLATLARSK